MHMQKAVLMAAVRYLDIQYYSAALSVRELEDSIVFHEVAIFLVLSVDSISDSARAQQWACVLVPLSADSPGAIRETARYSLSNLKLVLYSQKNIPFSRLRLFHKWIIRWPYNKGGHWQSGTC